MAKRKNGIVSGTSEIQPDGGAIPYGALDGQEPVEESKPKESKADKFRRLANKRVPNAVKRLKHVLNLCNRNQYEWTQEQADKIIGRLDEVIDQIRGKLLGVDVQIDDKWQL